MAFGGVHGRMTQKQRSHFLRTANRRLPAPENPHGVPSAIMKELAQSGLSNDLQAFNLKLQELLKQETEKW